MCSKWEVWTCSGSFAADTKAAVCVCARGTAQIAGVHGCGGGCCRDSASHSGNVIMHVIFISTLVIFKLTVYQSHFKLDLDWEPGDCEENLHYRHHPEQESAERKARPSAAFHARQPPRDLQGSYTTPLQMELRSFHVDSLSIIKHETHRLSVCICIDSRFASQAG